MTSMLSEQVIAGIIGVIAFSVVAIGILLICFLYSSKFLNDYNTFKANEIRKQQEAEARDRELITQAKNHAHQYTEEFVKNLKKEHDFNVNFDINLKGTIVRTEVVYVE